MCGKWNYYGDGHNIVHMYESFTFRSHACIAFEVLSMSLYDFAKKNKFAGMQLGLIRHFAQQLLVSLRFLRTNHIMHCDIKPENILLCSPNKPGIKLIDFGSGCFEAERKPLPYIQSRFYRAPEIILGLPYDQGIDMWSLACVLAELYIGRPLFQGETESEQLACIMEALGVPPRSLLEKAARRTELFDNSGTPRPVATSRVNRKPGSRSLATTLACCPDAGFVAFLQSCLQWDPRDRPSPDKALTHSWICEGAPHAPQLPQSPQSPQSPPQLRSERSATGLGAVFRFAA